MIVVKFGGTSLAGTERMRAAARIVAAHRRDQSVVCVVSAMAEVTDMLIRAATQATGGDTAWQATLTEISMRHLRVLHELTTITTGTAPTTIPRFEEALAALEADLCRLVNAPETSAAARGHALAAFSGWGERLCVLLFSIALAGEGVPSAPCNGEPVVMIEDTSYRDGLPDGFAQGSDHGHGADIPWERLVPSVDATRDALVPFVREQFQAGAVPVLPGYLACTPDGVVTTLGRNGSDHSAAVVAAALNAEVVYLYSNVAGVHQADPHVVPEAAVLPRLTYADAAEIAALGARVLHPATLRPLVDAGIPLRLRCSWSPDAPGTEIGPVSVLPALTADLPSWVVAARPLSRDGSLGTLATDWKPGMVEVTGLYLRHADWDGRYDNQFDSRAEIAADCSQAAGREDGPASGAHALVIAALPPVGLVFSNRCIRVSVPAAESADTQRRLYRALARADARADREGEAVSGELRRTS